MLYLFKLHTILYGKQFWTNLCFFFLHFILMKNCSVFYFVSDNFSFFFLLDFMGEIGLIVWRSDNSIFHWFLWGNWIRTFTGKSIEIFTFLLDFLLLEKIEISWKIRISRTSQNNFEILREIHFSGFLLVYIFFQPVFDNFDKLQIS